MHTDFSVQSRLKVEDVLRHAYFQSAVEGGT